MEQGKDIHQIYSATSEFCLKLALAVPTGVQLQPQLVKHAKSCLEKGKLTSEVQDSLESKISLVENKFSLAFKKCYTVNPSVAESN